jgi:hypothetical protein
MICEERMWPVFLKKDFPCETCARISSSISPFIIHRLHLNNLLALQLESSAQTVMLVFWGTFLISVLVSVVAAVSSLKIFPRIMLMTFVQTDYRQCDAACTGVYTSDCDLGQSGLNGCVTCSKAFQKLDKSYFSK